MKYLRYALLAVALLVPSLAQAAPKFWVGGTGTWDSSTMTHWSGSSGGGGGAAAPVTGDTITFDGSSGGGTVTVDATVSGLSFAQLTTSAFTGTIDFSAGINLTFTTTGWVDAGTGAHTITLGSSSWTFANLTGTPVNLTGASLTLSAASSTITFAPSSSATASRAFATDSKSFGTIVINGTNQNGQAVGFTGSPTIATLTLTNGPVVQLAAASTVTITNALTVTGTSANPAFLQGNSGTTPIILANGGASFTWTALDHVSFAGSSGAVNATNSFDLTGNNMNGGSITAPTVAGGGHIIGG